VTQNRSPRSTPIRSILIGCALTFLALVALLVPRDPAPSTGSPLTQPEETLNAPAKAPLPLLAMLEVVASREPEILSEDERDLLTQVLALPELSPRLLRAALVGLLPERCEPVLAWAEELAVADGRLSEAFVDVVSTRVPIEVIGARYDEQLSVAGDPAGRRLLVLALGRDPARLARAAREDPDAGVRSAAWLTLSAEHPPGAELLTDLRRAWEQRADPTTGVDSGVAAQALSNWTLARPGWRIGSSRGPVAVLAREIVADGRDAGATRVARKLLRRIEPPPAVPVPRSWYGDKGPPSYRTTRLPPGR
jgi:hypothetical protein